MLSYVEMLDLQCSKQKNSRLGHTGRNREFFFEKFDYISYCAWRICSKQIGTLRPHILGRLLCFASAHRASAFLLACPGVDGCFPDVSLAASPPHPLMASRRHHLRRQAAVQRIVPLDGDLRTDRCKIVEAGQNAPSRAVGTAGVFRAPCSDDSLPFVTKGTPPPNLPVAEGSNLIWCQTAVALRVPLRSKPRKERRQIILAGHHGFSRADRALGTSVPAQDAGPPGMAFPAFPPNISFTSRQHICGL